MQELTSRKMIGVGEQRNELYYFRRIRHEKAYKVGKVSLFDI